MAPLKDCAHIEFLSQLLNQELCSKLKAANSFDKERLFYYIINIYGKRRTDNETVRRSLFKKA